MDNKYTRVISRAEAIFLHCIVSAIAVLPVQAQGLLTPGTKGYMEAERFFRENYTRPQNSELKCSLHQIPPRVAFSFRFFTGFVASIPARQFKGNDNALVMAMRVTPLAPGPDGAPPVPRYFASASELPPVPADPGKIYFEFSGGVYTGEGKYKVEMAVIDRADRGCRASWTASASDRKIPVQQAPNTVQPTGLEEWKGLNPHANGGRVTVFLHAIPLYYRRALSKLSAYDRLTLLGSLLSLLDQSKFSKARVVVYDLLGKRILFEQENFDAAGYRRLVRALERAEYGTVDVKALQQGGNETMMVRRLLREEMARKEKSDAVVFLGAEGRPAAKATPDLKEYDLPAMFYMGFTRFRIPMEDAMYQAVRSRKGKTITVFRPVDLANGIRSLMQTANPNPGGSP